VNKKAPSGAFFTAVDPVQPFVEWISPQANVLIAVQMSMVRVGICHCPSVASVPNPAGRICKVAGSKAAFGAIRCILGARFSASAN
jgi:hypothetical protein